MRCIENPAASPEQSRRICCAAARCSTQIRAPKPGCKCVRKLQRESPFAEASFVYRPFSTHMLLLSAKMLISARLQALGCSTHDHWSPTPLHLILDMYIIFATRNSPHYYDTCSLLPLPRATIQFSKNGALRILTSLVVKELVRLHGTQKNQHKIAPSSALLAACGPGWSAGTRVAGEPNHELPTKHDSRNCMS